MPLILISGYPASGKTYRSIQLVEFFKSKIQASSDARTSRLTVCHIDDQSLGLDRHVYREARTEKDARAAQYSAVKRALGKDTIVVADGLNYIKGFRYQLHCEAKAVQTPSCVVHVGTPIDRCREINTRILESNSKEGYPVDIFDNLVYRYEEPNGMARWDSPLFTVPYDDEVPPCQDIWDAIIGSEGKAKTAKPNLATVMKPATESDYLYELDKTSQEILNMIVEWQKNHPGEGGGELAVAEGTIELPAKPVTLPQMQRIRRQFISLNRQHNLPKTRIRNSFIEYLNDNFV